MAQFYGQQSKRPMGMRVKDDEGMRDLVSGFTGWAKDRMVKVPNGPWEPRTKGSGGSSERGWELLPDGRYLVTAGKNLKGYDEKGVYVERGGQRVYGMWDATLGGYVFDDR